MKTQANKRPIIVIINIIFIAIGLLTIILKFTNTLRFELSLQYLGVTLTYFDYGMDLVLLFSGIFIEYGLYNAKRWAWKAVFWLYGIYLAGKVFGFILGLIMYEKMMEFASMLRYGDKIHANMLSFEIILITGIVVLIINGLIAFFILRSHYRAKDYFHR